MENKDPILAALARIEAKTDQTLKQQEAISEELAKIHKDTKRTAAVVGGASGAATATIVSVGVELIRRVAGG